MADQAITATTAETMSFTGCSLVGSHSKTSSFFFSHFFGGSVFFFNWHFLKKLVVWKSKTSFGVFSFSKKIHGNYGIPL